MLSLLLLVVVIVEVVVVVVVSVTYKHGGEASTVVMILRVVNLEHAR